MQLVPFTVALKNGQKATVREVGPEDKHLLNAGFEHLSSRSRYFRFLAAHNRLSGRELVRFTEQNNDQHVAIGAAIDSGPGIIPAGIARFIRLNDQRDVAEFAITIVDEFQGMGLGGLMLGVLAKYAVLNGIFGFKALVHSENERMHRLIGQIGGRPNRVGDTEIEYSVPLFSQAQSYPESDVGTAFRRAYELATFTEADA